MNRSFPLLLMVVFTAGMTFGCDEESGPDYECLVHSDCSGETLCLDRFCEDAYDRFYILDNIDATVVSTDAGWDLGGGAPDLVVCAWVDNEQLGCTGVANNKFTFWFTDSWQFKPVGGSTLEIALFDYDDVSDSERIATCISEITIQNLRSNGSPLLCQSTLGDYFTFSISPK